VTCITDTGDMSGHSYILWLLSQGFAVDSSVVYQPFSVIGVHD